MNIDWQTILYGGAVYGVLSYLARTIPPVANPWARWLIGGVQYFFANPDLAHPPTPAKLPYEKPDKNLVGN